jgi:hypothetical protein
VALAVPELLLVLLPDGLQLKFASVMTATASKTMKALWF